MFDEFTNVNVEDKVLLRQPKSFNKTTIEIVQEKTDKYIKVCGTYFDMHGRCIEVYPIYLELLK
jgi:hypothetical protein